MLMTAYPIGYLADKYRRSMVVAWGGLVNLLALATLALAVVDPYSVGANVNFWILIVSVSTASSL